jgi:replicative DNA helicase
MPDAAALAAPLAVTTAEPIRRPLPHNIEAEQALLGAILCTNRAYRAVSEFLRPEHFAEAVHGRIYAAIAALIDGGSVASPVLLKSRFEQDLALTESGGWRYLVRLVESTITIVNAEDYGKTIVKAWELRQIIEAAEEMVEGAYAAHADGSVDGAAVKELAENRLLALHDARQSDRTRSLASFAHDGIAAAERAYKGETAAVPWGLVDLDEQTGGLQPSDLIYLAGRPSMGKSALAGTVAFNAARAGHPVFFATLEMSGEQVGLRALSDRTGIAVEAMRTGRLEQYDFERLMETAAAELEPLPVQVADVGGMSLVQLRNGVRRFLLQMPRLPGVKAVDGKPALPLVIVDYIQLMAAAGRHRDQNRNEDISEISRGLKAMAKGFGLPVLALSQLSRRPDERDNKRPMLSDLRDSGSLEQDADVVAFVFREEYYLDREEPTQRDRETKEQWQKRRADWRERLDAAHHVAEVIIAKQRHGRTGCVIVDETVKRAYELD